MWDKYTKIMLEITPTLEVLQERYLPHSKAPAIPVRQHEVIDYDALLEGEWTQQVACHG